MGCLFSKSKKSSRVQSHDSSTKVQQFDTDNMKNEHKYDLESSRVLVEVIKTEKNENMVREYQPLNEPKHCPFVPKEQVQEEHLIIKSVESFHQDKYQTKNKTLLADGPSSGVDDQGKLQKGFKNKFELKQNIDQHKDNDEIEEIKFLNS